MHRKGLPLYYKFCLSNYRWQKGTERWRRGQSLSKIFIYICISPNVGRYYGLVTGPPPAMEATMEAMATLAMEAAMEAATERF